MAKKAAEYENNRQSSIVNRRSNGFSLTEVLIATGIMAVGLVMVATIFPVGVKLTALTTERTIGAVVADEAFAKIQLYGLRDFEFPVGTGNPNWPVPDPSIACTDYQYVSRSANLPGVDMIYGTQDDVFFDSQWSEFQYPSVSVPAGQDRNYHWSALCRRVGPKDVQVTVFVSRKIAAGASYRAWNYTGGVFTAIANSPWPKPVKIAAYYEYANPKELVLDFTAPINTNWGNILPLDPERVLSFVDDGYTIVDDRTGTIYRVLEVNRVAKKLILQEAWKWFGYPISPGAGYTENPMIWVVPPAVGSDRYPCVGVYQKVIRFDEIQ